MPSQSPPQSLVSRRTSRRNFLGAACAALAVPTAVSAAEQRPINKPFAMTVRGPLPPEDLGFTLPHEHVLITHDKKNPARDLTDPEAAVRELKLYAAAGGKSLCELTNIGIKRNPAALREISERTGVQIIMGAGFYKDEWLPPATHERSVEDLAAEIVRDIEVGVGETGIRAGIIGEVGLSSARQWHARTATEEKCLRAAARAQRLTGVGMNIHFDIPADPAEHMSALEMVAAEGADLGRVALSHFVPDPDKVPHFRRLAKLGCFIEFDLFGQEKAIRRLQSPPEDVKLQTIRALIEEGLGAQLLLSQDICWTTSLVENGGQGYVHLLKHVLPKLVEIGVSQEAIRTITVENPRRLLTIQPKT